MNHQKLFSLFPPLSSISSYVLSVGIIVGDIIAILIKNHIKKTPMIFKSETELLQISTTFVTKFALFGKRLPHALTTIAIHAINKKV